MNTKINLLKLIKNILVTSALLSAAFTFANASTSIGNIDTTNRITKVCQDAACTTFGQVNFKPTIVAGVNPVVINDTSITGHAWGNQIGWINLNPTGLTAGDVLKVNPVTGVVTGKAYANSGSWINFSPTGSGVALVDNGTGSNFSGYAWVSGTYGGWIKFDCSDIATCVKTDWRIISQRSVPPVTPPTSGGGGGSIILFNQNNLNNNQNNATVTSTTTKPKVENNIPTTKPTVTSNNTQNNAPTNNNQNKLNTKEEDKKLEEEKATTTDIAKEINPVPPFPAQNNNINAENKVALPEENLYREVFPFYESDYNREDCIFCILIRDDAVREADAKGNINVLENNKIIKYGFVPKAVELPVGLGLTNPELPKVDVTSVVVTAAAAYLIRRYLILEIIRRFFTGGI